MRTFHQSAAAAATLLLVAGAALAASDYYLTFGDRKGDAADGAAPAPIEVQSFSWGMSNPTSVGGGGLSAGKVNVQDLSVMKAAPRDSSTGLATGRRAATAATATVGAVAAPVVGEIRTIAVDMRESPTLAASALVQACASGAHIPSITLTGPNGTVTMQDVVVTSCAVEGARRKGEFTGHVTLIK